MWETRSITIEDRAYQAVFGTFLGSLDKIYNTHWPLCTLSSLTRLSERDDVDDIESQIVCVISRSAG